MILAVGSVWLVWLAGWLWRVELSLRAADCVEQLGFAAAREGFGLSVCASGTLDGVPVQLRWKKGPLGVVVAVRLGGARQWTTLPPDADVEAWVRGAAAVLNGSKSAS